MNKAVPDVAALLLGAIAEAENGLGCGGGRFSQALLIASEPRYQHELRIIARHY